MIKLTPKPNYKYLRISDNSVCEGAVYLGIFDKVENYKLITDEEATAIKKKQRQEEAQRLADEEAQRLADEEARRLADEEIQEEE